MPKPSSTKPRRKKKENPPETTAKLTRHAAFSPEIIHRKELKNAPYNPRKITDEARRRLRKNIERVGLIEPIIWNRRTGHIVGGHQRLKALDALEGNPDYLVPVAAVDLSEAEEKAQNVFLNNGEAQGEWELDTLAELLKGLPEPELTGFDSADLYQLFGFGSAVDDEREKDIDTIQKPAEKDKRDQEWDRREKEAESREEGHFFLVVTFLSNADRFAFTEALGLPDNRYVDGKRLRELMQPGLDAGKDVGGGGE